MKVNFAKFEGSLPYASQATGVYQTLMGWKSLAQTRRIREAVRASFQGKKRHWLPEFQPQYSILPGANAQELRFDIKIGEAGRATSTFANAFPGSILGRRLTEKLTGIPNPNASQLHALIKPAELETELNDMHAEVLSEYSRRAGNAAGGAPIVNAELERILRRESVVAGQLAYLHDHFNQEHLERLLGNKEQPWEGGLIGQLLPMLDPEEYKELIPSEKGVNPDISRAAISPIGLLHLYRHYYFEFDSFLGSPVQHVWLSPGGSVELVEVSTRKTLIERQIEQSVESIFRTEAATVAQDELSDGVRNENVANTKLGVTSTGSLNYGVAFINGSASLTGTLNYDTTQKLAREQTHKRSREQTEKVSTELKQSYRSVFKTVTETVDVNSRRYVLENNTKELVNYELRRKMRQVGVQVQDMGSRLCWQVYVDNPGRKLGLGLLVHASAPQDILDAPSPADIPAPAPYSEPPQQISIHWAGQSGTTRPYQTGLTSWQTIRPTPKPGFVYDHVVLKGIDMHGWGPYAWPETSPPANNTVLAGTHAPLTIVADTIPDGIGGTEQSIREVYIGVWLNGGGKHQEDLDFQIEYQLFYRPAKSEINKVQQLHDQLTARNNEEQRRAYRQALYEAARARIKAEGQVGTRKFEDLREEERVVVYRSIITTLLDVANITDPDNRLRHVFAEMISSMFEMDSLLYFVAPEWWKPRHVGWMQIQTHINPQQLALDDEVPKDANGDPVANLVPASWGGDQDGRPDNYLITEEAQPAKLGASLGWTLQLDGDDMRNAFLNAPWVKAVVPMRSGMEWKALRWLQSPEVEGSEGLAAKYDPKSEDELEMIASSLRSYQWDDSVLKLDHASIQATAITVLDALRYLIIVLQAKDEAAKTKQQGLNFLPPDMVYEFGFDPLPNGFVAAPSQHFEVFDQWVEVVPTDQIVAAEVKYDPKTGFQV